MASSGDAEGIFRTLGRRLQRVWHLRTSIQLPDCPDHAFHRELRTLAAPHITVLVHKRQRMVGDGSFVLSGRWQAELAGFAASIERFLSTDLALDRGRLLGMLDDIVWQAQLDHSLVPTPLPATSRFDMRWAN